jgi:predicted DNA-binding protein
MPTLKKRLNISLSSELETIISRIAKRDSIPEATKVVELLEVALSLEEDLVLGDLASRRDVKGAKFVGHEDVWK